MSVAETVQDIPQGLKPAHFRACYGTAEAVPLQNTGERELMG
jgi:hypothetical protein